MATLHWQSQRDGDRDGDDVDGNWDPDVDWVEEKGGRREDGDDSEENGPSLWMVSCDS